MQAGEEQANHSRGNPSPREKLMQTVEHRLDTRGTVQPPLNKSSDIHGWKSDRETQNTRTLDRHMSGLHDVILEADSRCTGSSRPSSRMSWYHHSCDSRVWSLPNCSCHCHLIPCGLSFVESVCTGSEYTRLCLPILVLPTENALTYRISSLFPCCCFLTPYLQPSRKMQHLWGVIKSSIWCPCCIQQVKPQKLFLVDLSGNRGIRWG